jgi:pyridoxal 5'-phosphate synthase pdxT subunit
VLVGVLALQGDFAEHRAALSDLGAASRPVRRPADLSGIDGLIVPGGESTTMSMLLDSSGLAEPVGLEVAAGMPVFGTCAGMILLARRVVDGRPDQRSYGAIDLIVRRNGYGRQLDSFECDLAVPELGERSLHAVFIRAPLVESLGPEVEVLSNLDREPALVNLTASYGGDDRRAGVSRVGRGVSSTPVICRQSNVLVAAFHPELTSDRRLHDLFLSSIRGPYSAGSSKAGPTTTVVSGANGSSPATRTSVPAGATFAGLSGSSPARSNEERK